MPTGRPRPKYLGLPGEKPVIGLEHVVGRHVAYIVEGPVDWLAAVGWQLPAFAICGTHFPPERLPVLAEALAVYGVFDPDRAGRSAAERQSSVAAGDPCGYQTASIWWSLRAWASLVATRSTFSSPVLARWPGNRPGSRACYELLASRASRKQASEGSRRADLGPLSGWGPWILRLATARKVHNRL